MISDFSRRRFLQTGALMTGGVLASGRKVVALESTAIPSQQGSAGSGNHIRFGIIGVGMEGAGLLAVAVTLPGVECVGAADLYDGRHTLAKQLTNNPNLPTTRNYHELLDRKEIDCIICATPDFWHQQVVLDSCKAGKDVYCEKPMSHTVAEGFDMVQAAKQHQRIVMVGSQRVSSALCRKAHELYSSGAIGDVSMVELSLGRNSPTGAWEYPPPFDLSPTTLDWDTWLKDTPKIPFNPDRFARWRCWRDYGTGVAGDLMVHLLSGMQVTLGWNEPPRSAVALGGIFRWKDGRDMPDLHTVLFDYHGIPVYVRLGLGTETPEEARFMGPHGIINATEFGITYTAQTGEDTAPSYYDGGFPQPMRAQYEHEWHEKHDHPIGQEPISQQVV
jgi:predicted dehydrogenase